jgi:hypothetical protein
MVSYEGYWEIGPGSSWLYSYTATIIQKACFLAQSGKNARVCRTMTNHPSGLSAEAIQEFRAIYAAEFGDELTDDEAQEMGMRLLRLFNILAGNTEK